MLFRTVYGPELEAIYNFISDASSLGQAVSRTQIQAAFVPEQKGGGLGSTQNVDDALLFLRAAGLIHESRGFAASSVERSLSFRLGLLRALRRIQCREVQIDHPIDPIYGLLLDELFIKPDRLFVPNVHAQANQLRQVKEAGGLSREKTQAWQRVMVFLGVGQRVAGGFLCVYSPDLIMEIVRVWSDGHGTLQSFCEEHMQVFLPFARQSDGDIAATIQVPLDYLVRGGHLELFPLQDSPSKPYFGERRFRGIRVQREIVNEH